MDRPCPESGFSLLEAVFVTSVIGVVAAIALPALDLYLGSDAREEARSEIAVLGTAVEHYLRDVESFPPDLDALLTAPEGVEGWMGPYLSALFTDPTSALDDATIDPWGEAYSFEIASAAAVKISSTGENRVDENGLGDDLVLEIDGTPILREITRRELVDLNIAVIRHNRDFLPASPLTPGFADNAFVELQVRGYFPTDTETVERYATDAWNQDYATSGIPVFTVITAGPPY